MSENTKVMLMLLCGALAIAALLSIVGYTTGYEGGTHIRGRCVEVVVDHWFRADEVQSTCR